MAGNLFTITREIDIKSQRQLMPQSLIQLVSVSLGVWQGCSVMSCHQVLNAMPMTISNIRLTLPYYNNIGVKYERFN